MGYVDWDHYGPELKSAFRNGPVRGNLFPAKKGLEILSFSFLGKKEGSLGQIASPGPCQVTARGHEFGVFDSSGTVLPPS